VFLRPRRSIGTRAYDIGEKEAIFNVLLVNGLIVQNGDLFAISDKGEKFLRHIGMLK